MKDGVDNRKFPRVSFNRAVRCRGNASSIFYGHLAKDLSQGGIRFVSEDFLPLGTVVSVQVQLGDAGRIFDLEGAVVWVRQQPHAEGYQVGIEFVGGPSFEKWKISQFVGQKD